MIGIIVESVCVFSGGKVVNRGPLVDRETLRRQLDQAREESIAELEAEGVGRAEPTVVDHLSRLKVLYERGLITEQQYEEKRSQLLEEFGKAGRD